MLALGHSHLGMHSSSMNRQEAGMQVMEGGRSRHAGDGRRPQQKSGLQRYACQTGRHANSGRHSMQALHGAAPHLPECALSTLRTPHAKSQPHHSYTEQVGPSSGTAWHGVRAAQCDPNTPPVMLTLCLVLGCWIY